VARDKHDPRRRWQVYEFKTPRGVITLMRALVVRRIITKEIRVYED
jgi:hypothetical protein